VNPANTEIVLTCLIVASRDDDRGQYAVLPAKLPSAALIRAEKFPRSAQGIVSGRLQALEDRVWFSHAECLNHFVGASLHGRDVGGRVDF
jgi:hypothetical protein